MIEVFRQPLSIVWSYAARLLDANRRRFSTFDAGAVNAVIGTPLATPARVVARAPVATRQTLAYREKELLRRCRGTTRL